MCAPTAHASNLRSPRRRWIRPLGSVLGTCFFPFRQVLDSFASRSPGQTGSFGPSAFLSTDVADRVGLGGITASQRPMLDGQCLAARTHAPLVRLTAVQGRSHPKTIGPRIIGTLTDPIDHVAHTAPLSDQARGSKSAFSGLLQGISRGSRRLGAAPSGPARRAGGMPANTTGNVCCPAHGSPTRGSVFPPTPPTLHAPSECRARQTDQPAGSGMPNPCGDQGRNGGKKGRPRRALGPATSHRWQNFSFFIGKNACFADYATVHSPPDRPWIGVLSERNPYGKEEDDEEENNQRKGTNEVGSLR